jgi:hypothetical protein
MAAALTLLSAVTVIAAGTAFAVQLGGDYMFAVNGTLGGATAWLEMLGPDGSNYISMGTAATFVNVAGACVVSIPAGTYRANLSAGAGPYAISATLKAIQ